VSPLDFAHWVQSLGPWGPIAFIAGYTLVTVAVMPAFLLTIAAGALWGFWFGLLFAMSGAVSGATCAFLGGRSIFRSIVQRYVNRHPRLLAIDRAVEQEGARLVFLLRLSPAVPFVLLNYVLGVSRITLRDHFIGLCGMVPTAAMYVYAGKVAGDLTALATGAATPKGTAYYVLLTIGLVATVAATVLVTRAAKRALEHAHQELV
jgi:uncharacterized membrane protein YdjX (TVP38/TMEM64 family)